MCIRDRLDILLGTVLRVSVDRTGSRCGQLCLDLCLLLQTLDLCTQVLDQMCIRDRPWILDAICVTTSLQA